MRTVHLRGAVYVNPIRSEERKYQFLCEQKLRSVMFIVYLLPTIKAFFFPVKISEEGLNKCANDITQQLLSGQLDLRMMFVKTSVHPQAADETGIEWVFFADTLNFSFWQPEDCAQYLVTYKGIMSCH